MLPTKLIRSLKATFLLALANTLQNRKRLAAALAGISFSLILIFMQLGFLRGAKVATTLLYMFMKFDVVIISDEYQSVISSSHFDKTRLLQAEVTSGVAATSILNVTVGSWEDPDTDNACTALLIGTDLDPEFIDNPTIVEGLQAVATRDKVMMDILSLPDYGDLSLGRQAEINGVAVTIASHFTLGMVFLCEGGILMSNDTYAHVTGSPTRDISFGLIKAAPGITPEDLRDRLRANLPDDVLVYTRDQLIKQEQDYFISVKPIGTMFRSGVVVAFLVGMVILYQVMATEISNRLQEFATMKAMGFSTSFIYMTGLMQAVCYSMFSYIPTLVISYIVFQVVSWVSHLPMHLTWQLTFTVFSLAMLMCSVSGVLALRKIKTADPAELF